MAKRGEVAFYDEETCKSTGDEGLRKGGQEKVPTSCSSPAHTRGSGLQLLMSKAPTSKV